MRGFTDFVLQLMSSKSAVLEKRNIRSDVGQALPSADLNTCALYCGTVHISGDPFERGYQYWRLFFLIYSSTILVPKGICPDHVFRMYKATHPRTRYTTMMAIMIPTHLPSRPSGYP